MGHKGKRNRLIPLSSKINKKVDKLIHLNKEHNLFKRMKDKIILVRNNKILKI